MDESTKSFLLWGCFVCGTIQALGVPLYFFGITWHSLLSQQRGSVKPSAPTRFPRFLFAGSLTANALGFGLLLYPRHPYWVVAVAVAAVVLIGISFLASGKTAIASRGVPGPDMNASVEESPSRELPSPSWVRFLSAYPEVSGPVPFGQEPVKKPQKIRCEFMNCSNVSYKVRVISWESGKYGLDADFWRGCLQLRIGTTWCPEWNGVEELHIPPSEPFRLWVFPKTPFNKDSFTERVNSGDLGTIHLLINGTAVAVPLER
jgi:hypothetical protein